MKDSTGVPFVHYIYPAIRCNLPCCMLRMLHGSMAPRHRPMSS